MALPLSVLFPLLWGIASSRTLAGCASASYFLAASSGLPQGVASFFGHGYDAGIALWLAASLGFIVVHTSLWTPRAGWGRLLRYSLAFVLMSIPPFGIIRWAHPITAAGVLFPGWGWLGLTATTIGILAITTRVWPIAIATLGAFWIWSAACWTSPIAPNGWIGADTNFGGAQGIHAGYNQQREIIEIVRVAAENGVRVIALPEGAIGLWTPTTERLWNHSLRDLKITVLAGAIETLPDGYDNVIIELSSSGPRTVYRQRMPVPVSMWQPWARFVDGGPRGAHAHLFYDPAITVASFRVAPLICYEQLLIWPVLQSMLKNPDVILAIGNGWWTNGTAIVNVQRATVEAWARLFNLPTVVSFNT